MKIKKVPKNNFFYLNCNRLESIAIVVMLQKK